MVVGNLSLIAHTYHQTLSQSASIVSVFAWTYAIATPLLALSTNRFNKRSLFLTLLAVFLAGTLLSAFAPQATDLLIFAGDDRLGSGLDGVLDVGDRLPTRHHRSATVHAGRLDLHRP